MTYKEPFIDTNTSVPSKEIRLLVKALQEELTIRTTSSSEPSKTMFRMELVGHKRYKFVQDSYILI